MALNATLTVTVRVHPLPWLAARACAWLRLPRLAMFIVARCMRVEWPR